MSKYIYAFVDYDDATKTHYYEDFKVIDKLPKIGDVRYTTDVVRRIVEVNLDCENDNSVYDYDFYKIKYEDTQYDNMYYEYVCIKRGDVKI